MPLPTHTGASPHAIYLADSSFKGRTGIGFVVALLVLLLVAACVLALAGSGNAREATPPSGDTLPVGYAHSDQATRCPPPYHHAA
jgi:hypothetical protein